MARYRMTATVLENRIKLYEEMLPKAIKAETSVTSLQSTGRVIRDLRAEAVNRENRNKSLKGHFSDLADRCTKLIELVNERINEVETFEERNERHRIGTALHDAKPNELVRIQLSGVMIPDANHPLVPFRIPKGSIKLEDVQHLMHTGVLQTIDEVQTLTRPETRVPPVELAHIEAHVLTSNKDHGAAAKILSMSIPTEPVFLCSCNLCLSDALKTVLIKKALRTDEEIGLCDICETRPANYTIEV